MTVYIASDHAACTLKEKVKKLLEKKKIAYKDLSPGCTPKDDYPDHAIPVAKRVAKEKNAKGILMCGSGTGMVIAANKVKGVRAVVAYDTYSARMSRYDNDTNVLCLRGRQFPFDKITRIINTWLSTKFSNKMRHKRRLAKIKKLEK